MRDSRPEFAELEHLADGLPAKERAAVVLRYGYDLSYADIGMALGSSEEAARQAASSGVRRLRQGGSRSHDRFPAARRAFPRRRRGRGAARRRLRRTDSPVGPLLVAVTERGLCRISFDAEPERQVETLGRSFGARVLRSPRPLDEVSASSTSTSPASAAPST